MPFRMRRITPGVVFLTALILCLAIACGPSAEPNSSTGHFNQRLDDGITHDSPGNSG